MNLKKSIGKVFHKLLDWKTIVNPITTRFYPGLYSWMYMWASTLIFDADNDGIIESSNLD